MKKSKEALLHDALSIARANSPLDEDTFNIAFEKAEELALNNKADLFVIKISLSLMDIKIKEAREKGNLSKHVELAIEFAKKFLLDYELTDEEIDNIITCIEEHHKKKHQTIEAEIVANADCYRFLYPLCSFSYLRLLFTRDLSTLVALEQLKNKMEEKYSLLTVDTAKEELKNSYFLFMKLYEEIKKNKKIKR